MNVIVENGTMNGILNSTIFGNGYGMMHDNDTMHGNGSNGNTDIILHGNETFDCNGNAIMHDISIDNCIVHDDGPMIEHGNGNGIQHDSIIIKTDNIDALTPDNPEVLPNKRRRKKSIVWEYFTTETISDDCTRACCKQCKKTFAYITGNKQAGTSHLKRHISLGICPANRVDREKSQLTLYTPLLEDDTFSTSSRKRARASSGLVTVALDQDRCIQEIARMIILDDYPVNMVNDPGFINFTRILQPHFSVPSFDSVESEIFATYTRLKNSLANTLTDIPGRVSLTMDLWTSDQTLSYVILTGHFIDTEWRLNHKVLKFVQVPFPESQVAFNHAFISCLSEWGLESKQLALTLDSSFANEDVIGNLRGLLSIKKSQLLNGRFVLPNCYARVMTRMVLEALDSTKQAISKVRDSVKYVKSSQACENEFNMLRQQLQLTHSQSLVIDNQQMWDSTYHMLSIACELKEVFSCLESSYPNFNQAPSMEEWKCIEVLCVYLKLFYDASNILTSETYPTSNNFFHQVCKIQMELSHRASNEDSYISKFVRPLYEKFDKYWRDCCVVLAMAVAMDPRFKLKLVEFSFAKIYREEAHMWLRMVDDSIHELYFEYVAQTLPLPSIHVEQHFEEQHFEEFTKTEGPHLDGISDFDVYISEFSSESETKSELDQYLEDPLLPRGSHELDVLEWWKSNEVKYPTLSKMAGDILSTPFSTVYGNSVFGRVSKKLDSEKSSLKPGVLEALVCANNWLKCV